MYATRVLQYVVAKWVRGRLGAWFANLLLFVGWLVDWSLQITGNREIGKPGGESVGLQLTRGWGIEKSGLARRISTTMICSRSHNSVINARCRATMLC